MNNEEKTLDRSDEIAIIGMAGRFPDAHNLDEFWQNLAAGVESVTFFTDEELLAYGATPAQLADPNFVKAGCILDDVESFDAAFFGYSPREVEIMDPQHRLFLETVWETLEHAGYNPETYPGAISLFGGTSLNKYLLMNLWPNPNLMGQYGALPLLIGSDKDFLTTRVSYKLNLKGASVNVQTACSTSLVAIHMAVQSLLNGECEMAMAGGVSVIVPQKVGYGYVEGGTNSPDGHCRTFDAEAKGTIPGSGVAIVLLKRLDDALADGDTIHAVIKGSAINNDGSGKVGYTAPSVDGQAGAIGEALEIAGVAPETVTYVETHGTATPLGDPIEVAALTQVFRHATNTKQFCALGSVKTNIGHLDAAAGATGLIKTVLAMKHRLLPPSLHYKRPNPKIDFANSPFYVNTELHAWESEGPLRAGVSSFGIGGTNAHVVLEEAPPREADEASREWQLLMLSARTETALETMTVQLKTHLQKTTDVALADVAYTLQVGRKAFNHRRVLVCRDGHDAVQALDMRDPKRVLSARNERQKRPVALLFGGVGDQYVGMAKELYESETTFQHHVDQCCELLKPHLGLDLRDILYPKSGESSAATKPSGGLDLRKMLRRDGGTDANGNRLNQTAIAHPTLFVIEYALTQLLIEWGIQPQAMIGHSLGEYVAACVAGVFTLENALALVAKRAQLIQALPNGAMLAIPLPERDIEALLGQDVYLATVNGPAHCVVSGTTEAVAALEGTLKEQGISSIRVPSSHAFHSPLLEGIVEEFTRLVADCNPQAPKIPYVSNVTGTWMTAEAATDPSYWARHMCQTVRFAEGVRELCKDGKYLLLEMGPGQTLSSFVTLARGVGDAERIVLPTMRNHYETRSDVAFLLGTLGQMWLNGVEINWDGYYAQEQRYRVPLPTYPFERQRFWIDAPQRANGEVNVAAVVASAPKERRVTDMLYLPKWERVPLKSVSHLQMEGVEKQRWLVFANGGHFCVELVEQLQQRGEDVVTVTRGEQFGRSADGYVVNPQSRADFEALIAELQEQGRLPQRVLHVWSLSEEELVAGQAAFEQMQESGYYSLLHLAQAFGNTMEAEPLDWYVLSNHLHDLESTDQLVPEKATLLGACKVIPQEYPNITCRTVDISTPTRGTRQAERLVQQLLAEFLMPSQERTLVYRGRHRYVQRFAPLLVDTSLERPALLREQGVYLLIGGFGAKGRVYAESLADTVKARLVLISRHELPPREEWSKWLEQQGANGSLSSILASNASNAVSTLPNDVIADRIRFVLSLEARGAEVLVLPADVANEEQMHDAVQKAQSHFGTLHGIIHAAGLMELDTLSTIADTGRAESDLHFQARVHGLYVLERVLQARPLDFCLLVSSITSVLGGLGFVAAAAAHQSMDAFAYQQNREGDTPWLTVNWDRMDDAEMRELVPHLFAFLEDDLTQVVVSKPELQASLDRWVTFTTSQPQAGNASGMAGSVSTIHPRPNLNNPYVEPTNELEQAITEILQDLLGIEQIGIYDNFFQLGGNSLLGTQVVTRIRNAFQIDLPLRVLFDANTAAQMALLVEEILIAELEALDDEEAERLNLS